MCTPWSGARGASYPLSRGLRGAGGHRDGGLGLQPCGGRPAPPTCSSTASRTQPSGRRLFGSLTARALARWGEIAAV
eukprot:10865467-Alexandrium_andersonii.AAC.1